MNGQLMYDIAKQRADERVRAAARAATAREARAAARGRRDTEAATAPRIPDYAHEMFCGAAQGTVPVPRQESTDGRHARA